MKDRKKNSNLKKVSTPDPSKNSSDDYVEVEIEKNFFIRTRKDHDRSRLEKWHIGRRNFS